jgi:prepilin peptidase CpaA
MIEHEALPHQHIVLILAMVVAALAAWTDWRHGEIPNWVPYGALLFGPVLQIGRALYAKVPTNDALTEGGFSIVGALICGLVPMILYRQGAIGGGDLKLFAGIGAIMQTTLGVEAEMYSFFGAALFAPAILAYQGKLVATLKNSYSILVNLFLPKAKRRTVEEAALSWLRLGPAVFFGVALTAYLHW